MLEVSKNGGRRPGPFYHVNEVRVYLVDKGGAGFLIERTDFTHTFFVLNKEWYICCFTNILNSSA